MDFDEAVGTCRYWIGKPYSVFGGRDKSLWYAIYFFREACYTAIHDEDTQGTSAARWLEFDRV